MQRSAWRPTSSARVSVRPLSSRTRWKSCGPSPSVVTRPHRRVRVHPLGGRGARQGLEEDLQVPPGRHDLLDADDRDQGLGQGQAHPAVALGLDDDQGAGLGDHEVRAGDADLGPQELLPQVEPGGLGQFARARRSGPRAPGGPTRPSRARRCPGSRRGCGGWPGPGCARAGRCRAARSARRGRSRTRGCPPPPAPRSARSPGWPST